jgi:hypothetical protein
MKDIKSVKRQMSVGFVILASKQWNGTKWVPVSKQRQAELREWLDSQATV